MNEVQGNQTAVEDSAGDHQVAVTEASDSVATIIMSDTAASADAGDTVAQTPSDVSMDAIDYGEAVAAVDSISEDVSPDPSGEGDATEPAKPTVRQRLIEQFERWLDRMSEGEPPPEGIPQEIINEALEAPESNDAMASDFYTLVSALTKLSGEVGIQGRTFKGLTDALAPIAQLPGRLDRIEMSQGILVQDVNKRAVAESKAAGPKPKEVLAVMFDLYDRLERGLKTFEASVDALRTQAPAGWRQRLLGGAEQAKALLESADAIEEGYRLTLSRLDAAFTQWGVERIAAEGEMFDPNLMAVIEVQPAPGEVDGTVLEVYKSGYLLQGQVLTTAQVKVCRNV